MIRQNIRYTFFILLLLVVGSMAALAQVSFVAKAPSTVSVGREFKVQFVLSNAEGEDFVCPPLKNVTILAGPSESRFSSFQYVNGSASKSSSVTYTYILAAQNAGNISIPQASIKVKGKTMHTRALEIKVTENSSTGNNRSQPQSADDEDFYVKPQHAGTKISQQDLYFTAEAGKKRVYEQEPILLTYKFHSKVGVGLANVMIRQKPDLKGFWTQEIPLPRNLSPTVERKGNELYKVGTNLKYLIFPQQTGVLTIPGITFDCDIVQQNSQMDAIDAFFNGRGSINVKIQRRTDDLNIEVLPLPKPTPEAFSGGVGQFQINAKLITPVPRTNDIATLRFTVSGTGNMKLIKAPKVDFPKDFETYDPKTTDHTQINAEGIAGEMYFDYTFVPRNVGKYTIPAIAFVFFDSQAERYVTLQTTPIKMDIEKGKRTREDVEADRMLRNADIAAHHVTTALVHDDSFAQGGLLWMGSLRNLIASLLLIACLMGLLIGAGKLTRHYSDKEGLRTKHACKTALRQLRTAQNVLKTGSSAAFYDTLSDAFKDFFASKMGIQATAMTHQRMIDILREKHVAEEEVEELRQLLETCDYARYAPNADLSQLEHDLLRSEQLVRKLDSCF